jgi:tRNA modification GTPase
VSAAAPRDTIAAIATAAGPGGVGIVRVSGPGAGEVLARVTGRTAATFEDRRMVLVAARDPVSGERVDDVLAVLMRGPRSYTGEDVAELHGHGGALNLARLVRACVAAGARPAEPGEFTRRAFENGRLDLTQVEAVAAVIGAESERALRAAQAQLAGALGARVEALRAELVAACADVEAAIDFPDEGLDFPAARAVAEQVTRVGAAARALAASYGAGRALREGVTVALVGEPNVGKSSLLNALVGEERALVHEEPGTTRDFVEARVVWDGVAVTLVDTAGEREADSAVERRGVELGRAAAARADVVVRVLDAARPGGVVARDGALVTWNKVDLAPAPAGALGVSARTGAGLEALRQAVLARVVGELREGAEGELVATERQRALFADAAAALARAGEALATARPLELVAADLRAAATTLARVSGADVDEEVLRGIFARFCIGK